MKRAEALEALMEIAEEQEGYITGSQARRFDVGPKDIERLVAGGDLQRVRRGVYRTRRRWSRLEDEIAAWLHLQRDVLPWERGDEPRAVLSHTSAAAFHQLGTITSELPTLTVFRGPSVTTARDLMLHQMQLPDQDWSWERVGSLRLPVTTPARTIIDLMLSHEEPSYLVRATREAIAREQATPETLCDAAHRRKSNAKTLERRVERLLKDAA